MKKQGGHGHAALKQIRYNSKVTLGTDLSIILICKRTIQHCVLLAVLLDQTVIILEIILD